MARWTSTLALLTALAIGVLGCDEGAMTAPPERGRPVKVDIVQSEQRAISLHYIGTTTSESILKYGFKVAGKLKSIDVKVGDPVTKGTKLARLDPKDYIAQSRATGLSARQAKEASDEAKRVFERISALYEDGARSEQDYEQAKLAFEIQRSTLEQARIKVGVDKRVLKDTTLRSETDGFVVSVMAKAGELTAPGHPVVVVRSDKQVVKVGVSQRDVRALSLGTAAHIEIDDLKAEGKVTSIESIPDMTSRTYGVEVSLEEALSPNDFLIGSIARVAFEVGTSEALWVPVTSVLTEGVSFVWVARKSRALRKNVTLGDVSGSEVAVEGLEPGDEVIVEGMKNLEDGYRVEIIK